MLKIDSNTACESQATDSTAGPRPPFVHLLKICSILCTVAGVPWALAVTLGHDTTLRTLQVTFIVVGAAGVIIGAVAICKRFAHRPFDRLLAIASTIVSFTVLTIALLVPWLGTIERAYVNWSRRYLAGDQAARADLRSEYAALMREAIREHYLVYSRMPTTSGDVAFGNPMFRNPDLLYRAD